MARPKKDPNAESEKSAQVSLGLSGLQRWNGIIDEEWHPRLQGPKAAKIYREMSDNDATIGAVLYIMESLVMQVHWNYKPSIVGDSEAEKWADFANSCRLDMAHTWPELVTEALSMVRYGHAPMEMTYKVRNGKNPDPMRTSRHNDGLLGWAAVELRSQDTIDSWVFDDHGYVKGFWQLAPPTYQRVFIPIWKVVNFRTRSAKNNPEGRSFLRNCYRPWYFLKKIQEIEAIGLERDLNGLPDVQVPPEMLAAPAGSAAAALFAEIKRQAQEVRQDKRACIIRPSERLPDGSYSGHSFQLLTTGNNRKVETSPIIQRYQIDMARVLLAQFLFLGTSQTGSFALSSNLTNTFGLALTAMLDMMGDTYDRTATRQLMELNGAPEKYWPILTHGEVQAPSLSEIADAVAKMVKVGAMIPDADLEADLRVKGALPPANPEARADYDARAPLITQRQVQESDDVLNEAMAEAKLNPRVAEPVEPANPPDDGEEDAPPASKPKEAA